MDGWAWAFIGAAVGFAFGAILLGRSYRDELAQRDAWERSARGVLRDIRDDRRIHIVERQRASWLLEDEAAA